MPILNTRDLNPRDLPQLVEQLCPGANPDNWRYWIYNALDSALTFEVNDAIEPLLTPTTRGVYKFSRALQAPMLDIMRTGLRVDKFEREQFLRSLDRTRRLLEERLNTLAQVIWGASLNANSPQQLASFFYNALALPPQYKKKKGQSGVTTDRDALEHLANYFRAKPFVSHILRIREITKLAATLRSEVDPDGRMRTSINIAGTETGRVSSSQNAFDTGTNLQNITEELRRVFIADPGHKLAYIDLEQAESRVVGFLCKVYKKELLATSGRIGSTSTYLESCEAGDLHTTVAKMVWPNLAWDSTNKPRDIAEQNFYRHFSYRDMSKRGGHGTNYYGTPRTMASHLKVPTALIEDFQRAYFRAFPEIKEWHTFVARRLQTEGQITTLLGRQRHFLGRRWDDATLREAIAFEPQSIIGDHLNILLLLVWQRLPEVKILLQVHDAILIQYKAEDESRLIKATTDLMSSIPIEAHGHKLWIPVGASIGWNWAKIDPKRKLFSDGNPFGLREWAGTDDRKTPTVLDRSFR